MNSWDYVEIESPVVKRYLADEEASCYMWYIGRSNHNPCSDLVGLAVSSNGIHWERGRGPIQSSGDMGLVLNHSKDWWALDTQAVRPYEVVIMLVQKLEQTVQFTGFTIPALVLKRLRLFWIILRNLVYKIQKVCTKCTNAMRDENGVVGDIFKSLLGLAMSQDGRHWARIEAENHTGALLDGYFTTGMVRSRDGIRWVKLGKIVIGGANGGFDEFGALNAWVLTNNRKDGKYLMVYEVVNANGRSIGLAVSTNGLKDWTRLQGDPVLRWSEEDGWDDKGVGITVSCSNGW
ncbi:hypothetical protein LguiA_017931 [Lonicera macranthoides]